MYLYKGLTLRGSPPLPALSSHEPPPATGLKNETALLVKGAAIPAVAAERMVRVRRAEENMITKGVLKGETREHQTGRVRRVCRSYTNARTFIYSCDRNYSKNRVL